VSTTKSAKALKQLQKQVFYHEGHEALEEKNEIGMKILSDFFIVSLNIRVHLCPKLFFL